MFGFKIQVTKSHSIGPRSDRNLDFLKAIGRVDACIRPRIERPSILLLFCHSTSCDLFWNFSAD